MATLGGYNLVARRDRNDGRSGGGILCFAVASISAQVILCEHSADYERSWLTIHSEIDPILVGVWYRPPVQGEVGSITACEAEWRRLASDHVADIMVGDMNVHHSRWLRHSAGISVEGISLYRFCSANSFKQLAKGPTHKNGHVLDLVISDFQPRSVQIIQQFLITIWFWLASISASLSQHR